MPSLESLLQKCGAGLFSESSSHQFAGDERQFAFRTASLGNVGVVCDHIAERTGKGTIIEFGGAGLDAQDGLTPALAEGLERYSTAFFDKRQFFWATAEELGSDAIDLDKIPHCSDSEYLNAKCPLIPPSKTAPIRWVRGLSLLDGRVAFLPAIMVYSHIGYETHAERFWFPISTGCAAHVSFAEAIVAGIFEVIERDAISTVWLRNISLPRIHLDTIPASLAPYVERHQMLSCGIQNLYFDATSDVGIPTAYTLQIAETDPECCTLVACSTAHSIERAIAKTIKDLAVMRTHWRRGVSLPTSRDDFMEPFHGASFMARKDMEREFNFLRHSNKLVQLSSLQAATTKTHDLRQIISELRRRRLTIYVVDLSTDEAIRHGMRVVRVLIPELQPLSFRHRARFLGHPRLYSTFVGKGEAIVAETDINSLPQPFA